MNIIKRNLLTHRGYDVTLKNKKNQNWLFKYGKKYNDRDDIWERLIYWNKNILKIAPY